MTDWDAQDARPCGEYHPLPCGLDRACPVPLRYFEADGDSKAICERWRADGGE